MLINVIGLGYIGLPTALMFASHGSSVIGTDQNPEVVSSLTAGELTFEESGINELFAAAMNSGIKFSTQYAVADVYIVAVPTPYRKDTKQIETSYVRSAVQSVLAVAPRGAVCIVESTVSPGTIDKCVRPLLREATREDVHLVHAPERIIPGNMIVELENNNRTIGADDASVGERIAQLYGTFCHGEIVVTDIRTAEMSKVVENTYRAVNIAFANELDAICDAAGLDVRQVIAVANKHPRVNILNPGPGVGGHCIPVDPWFLVGDFPEQATLVREAMYINEARPEKVMKRIGEIMEENGIDDLAKVGIYGLTYKADVDDVRESPTLQLLDKLRSFGIRPPMPLYDPMVKTGMYENQVFDFDEFVTQVDLVVVMVPHTEIKSRITELSNKMVLDTQNALGSVDNLYTL